MVNSGGSSEDQNAAGNADSKECAHDLLDINKESIGNLARGHSRYILTNNVSTFHPCPEIFQKPEFKSDWMFSLICGH